MWMEVKKQHKIIRNSKNVYKSIGCFYVIVAKFQKFNYK
jgi:hypothetical protein